MAELGGTPRPPTPPHLWTVCHFDPRKISLSNGVFALNKVKKEQVGLKMDQKGMQIDQKGLKIVFLD